MAYKHKEAFALMWYRCDACGHTERFWNSRDGVTPFGGVRCPSCGLQGLQGGLSHVHFHLDECVPDHKPYPGQRIWRDGTKDEAVEILTRRFAAFEARGQAVPEDVRTRMLAEIGQPTSEFQPGWPMWERTEERTFEQLRALFFARLDARRDQKAEDFKAWLDEIEAEEQEERAAASRTIPEYPRGSHEDL